MTDEEAELLVPHVDELVEAVMSRDRAMVAACLHHADPAALAVVAAGLLGFARARVGELSRVEAAYVCTRSELVEARARLSEWREIFNDRGRRKVA